MDDVAPFGLVIALLSLAGLAAVWSNRLSERIRVPAPALFLVAAAVAASLVPELRDIPVVGVQRVVTVMLVLLLFDGGMHIGVRRLRAAAGAVVWIGVMGTAVTSAGVAVLAHLVFGLDWRSALLIGVALAYRPGRRLHRFGVVNRDKSTKRWFNDWFSCPRGRGQGTSGGAGQPISRRGRSHSALSLWAGNANEKWHQEARRRR